MVENLSAFSLRFRHAHWFCVVAAWAAPTPAKAASPEEAQAAAQPQLLAPIVVPLPPPEAFALEGDSTASAHRLEVSPALQEAGQARELLSKAAGVHVSESGGMGQLQRLSVRGSANNAVAVLVDGMLWGRSGESVDLAFLPLALLESATLIRGAAAARFGPGAMAGALVFGLAKKNEERLFVELLGGSFGSLRGIAGGTGGVGPGHLSAWAGAMHSDNNFRYRFDPTPNLPGDSFLSLRRQNNHADKADAMLHYALPLGPWHVEAWTYAGFQKRGLGGPVENPSPTTQQSSQNIRALLRAQGPLGGPNSPFHLKLYGATQFGGMLLSGGGFAEGLSQRENSTEFVVDFSWTHGPHLVFAQGAFRYEALRSSQTFASRPPEKSAAERLGFSGMLGAETWLFAQRWALNALFRMDKAAQFASPSAKLGSTWLLPWGFALSGNAGRSFRIPSFFELYMEQGQVRPNPELLAESAFSFDVGPSWENEKTRLSLSCFWSRFENLIVWEYWPPFALKPFNLGKAQTYGVEVEASFSPWHWLQLELAYTWLQSKNLQKDERYEGKPLPFRPTHQLFARAQVGPRWLSAFVEWHFQSTQTRNSFANLTWPTRSLLNAGLKSLWLHNPQLQLSLTLKNLLNTHTQDMSGYPLPPRGLFFSLSLNFDRTPPTIAAPHPTVPVPHPSLPLPPPLQLPAAPLSLENG